MVEKKKSDIGWWKLIAKYGDHMEMQDFIDHVEIGCFTFR